MIEFNQVLNDIHRMVVKYKNGDYEFTQLMDMHAELVCLLTFLAEYRVKFKDDYEDAWKQSQEATVAARTRYAERTVKELYYCRKIHETGLEVARSMAYKIKANINN